MSNYLYKKFYGRYRVLAHLDYSTMDFPRNDRGIIETDDFYIPCRSNSIIYHYGKDTLAVFVPSATIGNKLLKLCGENGIAISHVIEGDGEVSFRFKAKDIGAIARYLKAKTSGKDIRPFSTRNLPKSSYHIPTGDLQDYKSIIECVGKGDILILKDITDKFINDEMQKRHRDIDIKKDIKRKCMSRQRKEYIHSMGEWGNYLEYLKQGIEDKKG